MNSTYPLANTAALIADPARAAILTALLDGRALPAGELARQAGVSPQSASAHLLQLVEGGFLTVVPNGRYRYYSLASREVAHAVESLGAISTRRPIGKQSRAPDRALCYARTCYDHLAGTLGVEIATAFQQQDIIALEGDRDFRVTGKGREFLRRWNIDADALRSSRRTFARRCLDWTEHRDHIAGALGAAICEHALDAGWLRRSRNSRALLATRKGQEQLEASLGLHCPVL